MSDGKSAMGMHRREFMTGAVVGGVVLGAGLMGLQGCSANASNGAYALMELPYSKNALRPVISERTVEFHYGKHHKAYVEKTNKMAKEAGLDKLPLEEIITKTAGNPGQKALFNNAAQAWNHDFYWNSLRPKGGPKPDGELAGMIDKSFGGMDGMKEAFTKVALDQFGSGWAWLVVEGGKLKAMNTPNAENPLVQGLKPILTIDVWEHAYYLDHQNLRKEYVEGVIDNLLNWEFAAKQLSAA